MHFTYPFRRGLAYVLLLGPLLSSQVGCVRRLATGAMADALSGTGTTFSGDNDPELVADALPFALKTMEALIPEQPEHTGLLAAAAGGYTQYAYGFLKERADALDAQASKDRAGADHLRLRARNLLRRARTYGVRGLAVRQKDFEALLQKSPQAALANMKKEDIPLLYWTAAALGAEIALDKDNLELMAELRNVEALLRRALELDETYDAGAIHEMLMTYELSRPDGGPEAVQAAKRHFDRARALSNDTRLSALVTWAESTAVKNQDRKLFDSLLETVLAFDVDKAPERRLANVIAQQKARRLQATADDLFI